MDAGVGAYEDADGANDEDERERAPVAVPRLARCLVDRPHVRVHRLDAEQEPQGDDDEHRKRDQLQHKTGQEDLQNPQYISHAFEVQWKCTYMLAGLRELQVLRDRQQRSRSLTESQSAWARLL